MSPYYDDGHGIVIYHGDCREILLSLPPANLVLTDPPYGVGFKNESYTDSLTSWRTLMDFVIEWIHAHAIIGILPCCQIDQLEWIYRKHPPNWLLCWYKGSPGHVAYVGFNDWEPLLVYGKPRWLQMHDYFFASTEPSNGHPCPKPLQWATHLIARTTILESLVIDPFMGSGTTLRAAKDLGRKAIGIEIEEKYVEIAIRRLQQEVLPLEIKSLDEKNEQLDLSCNAGNGWRGRRGGDTPGKHGV